MPLFLQIMFQISLLNIAMPSLLVVAAYVGYLRPEGFADTFFLCMIAHRLSFCV